MIVSSQILGEIVVGVVVALITVIINQVFQGRARSLLAVVSIVIAAAAYGAYLLYVKQKTEPPVVLVASILAVLLFLALLLRGYVIGFGQSPFIKWHVTLTADQWSQWRQKRPDEACPGLISEGDLIGKACLIRCRHHGDGVYGPYIKRLKQGKYRVIFKAKIGSKPKSMDDQRIIQIDVAASRDGVWGARQFALRELTYGDFKRINVYQDFSLDFDVTAKEGATYVEFRTNAPDPGPVIILDYIQLCNRLF